jgi:hypothetical protein
MRMDSATDLWSINALSLALKTIGWGTRPEYL